MMSGFERFLRPALMALALLLVAFSPARAQIAPEPEGPPVDMAELAKPHPLGDGFFGKDDAPVTIYEYASLTCSHCGDFHRIVMRQFKAKYIDTGKVRLVYRPFPLNPVDLGAYTLTRCRDKEQFLPLVDLLFSKQEDWAFTDKPVENLLKVVKEAGFTQESATACLKNSAVSDALKTAGDHAYEKLGVDSTPTFFIGGKRYVGALNLVQLDILLAPLLKN